MITTTGEAKDLAQLYSKIARVTAAMKRVPKTGRNDFHKYDYATEADIVDALRVAMGDAKLAVIPSVDSTERIDNPKGAITRLHMTFTVACGDTGSSISMKWVGEGQDTGDKAVYKAYTGAEKYFLMKLFLVATGDDPEQDSEPERPVQQHQRPPAQPDRAKLASELREVRQQLTAIGGVVVPLTSSQVAQMPIHELTGMIDATRIALKREQARLAGEAKQQELQVA